MSKEEKYLQWGYESYRNAETGEVRDDYIDLLNKQHQTIVDLESKLALTEKTLELACKELQCELENPDNELYTKSSDEYIDYFKTRAKEMMKSE